LTTRRELLLLGGAVLAGYGLVSALPRLRAGRFDFEPLPGVPGFRRIAGAGSVSAGATLFAGLDHVETRPSDLARAVAADPLPALFPGRQACGVPVAYFSDKNCTYCRVLTPRIAELQARGEADVHWHELPLLGSGSLTAARATLAAERQGAGTEFRLRLMRSSVVATPAYISTQAGGLGLDKERLLSDMDLPSVTAHIETSRALAQVFGIPGTPALVVGRTLVIGQISPARLDALIGIEAKTGGFPAPCA